MADLSFLNGVELTELHTHLGFSVSPTMLWEIAHAQGLKLPTKNYWEFEKMVTMSESKNYEDYLVQFDLTEKVQSSPEALFMSTQTAVSAAYRKNNITTLELRFNPILRSRDGERELDHLIVYALQGMERAMLSYPVRVGLILMMDRRFTPHENAAIVQKAIKYKYRGVIGVDLAGPIKRTRQSKAFVAKDIVDLMDEARSHGLGITVHTGEATNVREMWDVVEHIKPDRIGHGIASVHDPKLLARLVKDHIILETCPTSNLHTKLVKDFNEMRSIYRTFVDHGISFTINTDGPEMQKISLRHEYDMLLQEHILSEKELLQANETARKATFLRL